RSAPTPATPTRSPSARPGSGSRWPGCGPAVCAGSASPNCWPPAPITALAGQPPHEARERGVTEITSAVSAQEATRAGTAVRLPVRSSPRMLLSPSLDGQRLAQARQEGGAARGGSAGGGAALPRSHDLRAGSPPRPAPSRVLAGAAPVLPV